MVKYLSGALLLGAVCLAALAGEGVPTKKPAKTPSTQTGKDSPKPPAKAKDKAKDKDREREKQKALKLEAARLVKRLESSNLDERKAAEKRLGEIGKAAVGSVVKALGHDTWAVRECAQSILLRIGKPAAPALRKAAAGKDLEVTTRARTLLKEILGEGYLGVGLRWLQADERDVVPDGAGATASSIVKGGPGAKGGVEVGDIIHKVDGKTVKNVAHMIETVKAILPSTKVKLLVYRGGRKKELTVVLGRRPSDEEIMKLERR